METRLQLDILPQPDDVTCGPTCLHAIYRFFGDETSLAQVIREVRTLDDGGTLGMYLAHHALRRGYRARIYTYNLQVFDPTWFTGNVDLADKLRRRREAKTDLSLRAACDAFLEHLALGGDVRFRDLTPSLIRHYLQRDVPILTGLSATYLYHSARELPAQNVADDVLGDPAGHFVVLCGYDRKRRRVLVADPYGGNPAGLSTYEATIERVLGAILLGVLTHDANLLVLLPPQVPDPPAGPES